MLLRTLGGLLCGLLLLTGCSSMEGTNDGGYISGAGAPVQYAVDDRGDAVFLRGESLEGEMVDVTAMRGKVVVINIWWSQCGPCVKEMPLLQQAHEELGEEVEFVGINVRDNSRDNGLGFQRSTGVAYPSIYAPDGKALGAFPNPPHSMPATVILDREGRVAAVFHGEVPSKITLTDVIEDVLTDAPVGEAS